jgi:hypothetical protein
VWCVQFAHRLTKSGMLNLKGRVVCRHSCVCLGRGGGCTEASQYFFIYSEATAMVPSNDSHAPRAQLLAHCYGLK